MHWRQCRSGHRSRCESNPSNVNLVASDKTAGFTNVTGERFGVAPDTVVRFETSFLGDGQAHIFDLQFLRTGTLK